MCRKKNLTRRDLLQNMVQYSALAGAASLMGSRAFALPRTAATPSDSANPHYFLHINLPGGIDASYLFDARPLSMTRDGLIANYHGKDPISYTGSNGESTLRTTLTEPLMKFRDRFSIVNGVVMSSTLEGHDQLMNMLLTGNPFGGDSFLPWTSRESLSMDYVSSDTLFADLTNGEASMAISPEKCRALAQKINRVGSNGRLSQFLQRRTHYIATGNSSIAASSRRLETSARSLGDFSGKIAALHLPDDTASSEDPDNVKFLKRVQADTVMLSEFLRVGLTNAAVLILESNNFNVDTHDSGSAKQLPNILGTYCEAIAAVFEYLSAVPSASGRSMLDDTTFLIGGEFSRTMRQANAAIDKTGTDHNALTNTLIVGGKGVRGGMVVGQSDFASSGEVLSPAHLTADPARLKIMGRPFDLETSRTRTDLPQSFQVSAYLGASNVTNTLQQILGIPAAKRFLYGQSQPVAPVIKSLIA